MTREPFAIDRSRMSTIDLRRFPIHLGLGATALPLPEFTGDMAWYQRYSADTAADGAEGRLVALHTFHSDWPSWEMHPKGAEVVVVVAGELTLVQDLPEGRVETRVRAGEAAINPPGVWHTAKVEAEATALFITPGEGTQHASSR